MNLWSVLVAMISTSVLADQPLVVSPAAAPVQRTAPAPARMTEPRTTPLVAGPAVVSVSPLSRVIVRGQPTRNSEIITRLTNGEPVTVIEEVAPVKSRPDEPSAWAKIALPAKAQVWVSASYIDAAAKTVSATKLNLRAGPGENHSIIGTLVKGDAVQVIETKDKWMRIEPPAGTHAFIAAQYLTQEAPAAPEPPVAPPTPPVLVAETPVVVPPAEPAVTPPAEPTAPPVEPAPAQPEGMMGETVQIPPEPEPTPELELPVRIVEREGLVRGSFSIQAPTPFALISPDTGRAINYLYTTSTNLDLNRYKGLKIVVTGEEGLDQRWKNTPVITIQRIQVIE